MRGLSVSISLRFLCRPKEVFLKRVIWLVYFAVLALVLRLIHDLLELTGFPDFVFVLDFGFYQFTHVSMCYSTSVYPFPHFPGPTRAQRGETEAAGWTFCLANRHLSDQASKLQRGFGKRHLFPCQGDSRLSGAVICTYENFMDWLRLNVLGKVRKFVESQDLLMGLGALKRAVLDISSALLPGLALEGSTRCKYRLLRGGIHMTLVFPSKSDYTCLAWTWTWHRFRTVSNSCDLEQSSPLGASILAFGQGFSHLKTKPWPKRNQTLKARALNVFSCEARPKKSQEYRDELITNLPGNAMSSKVCNFERLLSCKDIDRQLDLKWMSNCLRSWTSMM